VDGAPHICGGGEQAPCALGGGRDYEVSWADTGTVALTPPAGEWTAEVSLELRFSDGRRVGWTESVELWAESLDHALVLPASAEAVATAGVGPKAGVALLVGYVRFDGLEGDVRPPTGLGGQFVSVQAGRLTPTTERFGAMMGVGLIDDPHDGLDLDVERAENEEVTR